MIKVDPLGSQSENRNRGMLGISEARADLRSHKFDSIRLRCEDGWKKYVI